MVAVPQRRRAVMSVSKLLNYDRLILVFISIFGLSI
jgi:hypothetical protein